MKYLMILFFFTLPVQYSIAETINVPDDFETIQGAVDASEDGDTVLVAPGEYDENNIYIMVWDLTIASLYLMTQDESYVTRTIIDADSNGCVFDLGWCDNPPRDPDFGVNFIGLTIQGASESGFVGWGAVFSLDHCIVRDNFGTNGGAFYLGHGNDVFLLNCVLIHNIAEIGGVFWNWENDNRIMVLNSVFWGNRANEAGSVIFGGESVFVNSILWNNSDNAISSDSSNIFYSDVQNGWDGEGNIDENPLFADVENGDFHLTEDSPCIDAGTAFFVWEDDTLLNLSEDEYNYNAPDMGAIESEYQNPVVEAVYNPDKFLLYSVFPNPFNSKTTIRYSLPQSHRVSLWLYDSSGRLIETLYNHFQTAGYHSVEWDSRDVGSGVFLARLQTEKESKITKLIVIK